MRGILRYRVAIPIRIRADTPIRRYATRSTRTPFVCHLHATPLLSAPFMFEVSKGNNGNKTVEQNFRVFLPAVHIPRNRVIRDEFHPHRRTCSSQLSPRPGTQSPAHERTRQLVLSFPAGFIPIATIFAFMFFRGVLDARDASAEKQVRFSSLDKLSR